jgi:hypothetical protein
LWKDFGEMVSVMEHNPGCSMGTLYELCESRMCRWIGVEISRERRDGRKINIYDVA